MKKFFYKIALLLICSSIFAQSGKKLEFKYKEGDNFSLISEISEDVFYNRVKHHHAEITSRVTERIDQVDENGRGHILASFMTTEKSRNLQGLGENQWNENLESEFWRDKSGRFEINEQYFMPVIRDMPVFPDRELKPGDKWIAEGYESEDLRKIGIPEPFKVPFMAQYVYLRDEEGISSDSSKEKRTFQVISARYTIYYETPEQDFAGSDYPCITMGNSDRLIWWDNEKGQIDHYTEKFRIEMETMLGNQFIFSGTTKVEYTEFKRTATEENVKDVMEKISVLGLDDISVTKTDKGLTISLENIQFKPDSAILQESEKEKIKKIADILAAYPENDLLISGHTARAGTEESCQKLSSERAVSVADFLIILGVRDKNRVFTQGHGSKVPVASNKTEEGKAKNRRVEITLLDK